MNKTNIFSEKASILCPFYKCTLKISKNSSPLLSNWEKNILPEWMCRLGCSTWGRTRKTLRHFGLSSGKHENEEEWTRRMRNPISLIPPVRFLLFYLFQNKLCSRLGSSGGGDFDTTPFVMLGFPFIAEQWALWLSLTLDMSWRVVLTDTARTQEDW